MSPKHPEPDLTDPDNPEWTEEDFARAQPPESFPELMAVIKRGRGRPPKPDPKVAVKLRLDPGVIAFFKAAGPGWQSRINDTLAHEVLRLSELRDLPRSGCPAQSRMRESSQPRPVTPHKS